MLKCILFCILIFAFWGYSLATEESGVIQPSRVEYKAENYRDPFQRYAEKEGPVEEPPVEEPKEAPSSMLPPPNFTVQGIIWGGRFPQAIINDKVVKVGDEVTGVRIVEINPNGISVLFENRVYNVPVSTLDKLLGGQMKTQFTERSERKLLSEFDP